MQGLCPVSETERRSYLKYKMGCCGKVKKIKQIASGYAKAITDSFGITTEYQHKYARFIKCTTCEYSTYLAWQEYLTYLKEQGIDLIGEIEHTERLQNLPKHKKDEKRRYLFCGICKCPVAITAGIENKKCPHPRGDKWKELKKNKALSNLLRNADWRCF